LAHLSTIFGEELMNSDKELANCGSSLTPALTICEISRYRNFDGDAGRRHGANLERSPFGRCPHAIAASGGAMQRDRPLGGALMQLLPDNSGCFSVFPPS
jgi:hypothetical protein